MPTVLIASNRVALLVALHAVAVLVVWALPGIAREPPPKADGATARAEQALPSESARAASPDPASAAIQTPPMEDAFHAVGDLNLQGKIQRPDFDTQIMPTGVASQLGFTVTVKSSRLDYAGYIPMEIKFTSTAGPLSADRPLTLVVTADPELSSPPANSIEVRLPLEIPEGSVTKTFNRMIPRYTWNSKLDLRLEEAGTPLPECETSIPFGVRGNRAIGEITRLQSLRPMLHIRANAGSKMAVYPDLSNVPVYDEAWQSPAGRLYLSSVRDARQEWGYSRTAHDRFQWTTAGGTELPTDWRFFQRFSAAVVDADDLATVRKKSPQRVAALMDWVRVGGMLAITGSDDSITTAMTLGFAGDSAVGDEGRLNQIGKIDPGFQRNAVAYQAKVGSELSKLDRPTVGTWRILTGDLPTNIDVRETARGSTMGGGYAAAYYSIDALDPNMIVRDSQGQPIPLPDHAMQQVKETVNRFDVDKQSLNNASPPRWLRLGAGSICIIEAAPGLAASYDVAWTSFHNQVVRSVEHPIVRRGVEPLLGDRRVTRWLIPGVAQPPVYTFIGLLLIFVVLVGPVAYRWTTKTGRGHLMFAIAPVLALLTTAAMLIYGILSDGFDTYARVRQITMIDGATGHAGDRSISTYFAGIRPAGGILFPADAEVMPNRDDQGFSWQDRLNEPIGSTGIVTIDGNVQRFDSQFLPSRDQRQFIVHRPRRDVGVVRLQTAETSGVATIVNETQFELKQVTVRDRAGNYWICEDVLPPGASDQAKSIEGRKASIRLGKMFQLQQLSVGGSTFNANQAYRNYNRETKDIIQEIVSSAQDGAALNGLFEQMLAANLLYDGNIDPGCFMALSDPTPDSIAVDDAIVVESIHFVTGTLP